MHQYFLIYCYSEFLLHCKFILYDFQNLLILLFLNYFYIHCLLFVNYFLILNLKFDIDLKIHFQFNRFEDLRSAFGARLLMFKKILKI